MYMDTVNILQWVTKVLRHFALKFDFLRLGNISPLSPKTMLIFLFLRQCRSQHLQNIKLGGRGYLRLTLDLNNIEQVLQYQKVSFSKSFSTTVVTYCSQRSVFRQDILLSTPGNLGSVFRKLHIYATVRGSLHTGQLWSIRVELIPVSIAWND